MGKYSKTERKKLKIDTGENDILTSSFDTLGIQSTKDGKPSYPCIANYPHSQSNYANKANAHRFIPFNPTAHKKFKPKSKTYAVPKSDLLKEHILQRASKLKNQISAANLQGVNTGGSVPCGNVNVNVSGGNQGKKILVHNTGKMEEKELGDYIRMNINMNNININNINQISPLHQLFNEKSHKSVQNQNQKTVNSNPPPAKINNLFNNQNASINSCINPNKSAGVKSVSRKTHLFLSMPAKCLDIVRDYIGQQIPHFIFTSRNILNKYSIYKIEEYDVRIQILQDYYYKLVKLFFIFIYFIFFIFYRAKSWEV